MADYENQRSLADSLNGDKTKQKVFVDMFKPVITWAMNNNNQMFEQIETQFSFDKVHQKNDPMLHVTVFLLGGDNESFTFYAWRDYGALKSQKEILKNILKARNLNEYKSLSTKFNKIVL